MTLRLKGYLRDNPGGAAVSGVTVSLLDSNTGLAPSTTAFTNLSGTSSVTDGTGKWEFTMDLCTGPLRVEADLGSGNKRHRRSDELFQYDGLFINQLPEALQAIGTGPIHGVGNEFSTSASATRVLTISSGQAIIKGHLFGWDSGTKAITGTANGAGGTTQYDFLCLRQWYAGTDIGKQDIVIVRGGDLTDPVATTTESDLTKFIQGANIWDHPIYRAKLAFGATVYTLDDLRSTPPYEWAHPYLIAIAGSFTVGNDLVVSDTLTVNGSATFNANTQIGNTSADELTLYGHIQTSGTAPTVATAATNCMVASSQSITQGTDTQFTVTGTTKSPPSAGSAFSITFNTARGNSAYSVTVTPRTSGASGGSWYITSKGTTGFDIYCNSVLSSGVTATLDVQVI